MYCIRAYKLCTNFKGQISESHCKSLRVGNHAKGGCWLHPGGVVPYNVDLNLNPGLNDISCLVSVVMPRAIFILVQACCTPQLFQ